MKPLAIDLYCGLGGWSEGLLAEGWDCIGFDIERHVYGEHRYPAQLVLQDILTLHGSQFLDAALIVASPPCQAYSYRAMPWQRAKALPPPDNTLFDACFRIQREACEAAGHHIPLIVENVRGAQPWVGRARWNFGSFYLWGDVPALMPMALRVQKFNPDGTAHPPGSWFAVADSKNRGGSWFAIANNTTSGVNQNPRDMIAEGFKAPGFVTIDGNGRMPVQWPDPTDRGIKHHRSGAVWFDTGPAALPSSSPRRKAASAMIAKIPLPLSRHIGRTFLPEMRDAAD